jgi:hypothetical protein
MVVVADSSKESRTPNHREQIVDQASVLKTPEQLPALETEVIIATDVSRRTGESKSPNQKKGEPLVEEKTVEQSWILDTAEQPSVLVNDVMIAADSQVSEPERGRAYC